MKRYEKHKILVQSLNELPTVPEKINELVLDFETTSGKDDTSSLNPWKDCQILGAAFTWDKHEDVYYIPMRQQNIIDTEDNLDIPECNKYIQYLISCSDTWINSNVKYDAHVATISAGADCSHITLVDLITLAKLVDSDRFRYALKHLVHDYLYRDVEHYEQAFRSYLFTPGGTRKCQNYGVVPLSLMVPYACQDVIDARDVYQELKRKLPKESHAVWKTEIGVTTVLKKVEHRGVQLDISKLAEDYARLRKRLNDIKWEIKDLTSFLIEPHTNADCYSLLYNHYGLPVVEETEKGEPSYNKEALKAYMGIPGAPHDAIRLIQEFRESYKLWTGFIVPYILQTSVTNPSYIHCNFNQVVRTGRMSCATPNLQQLPPEAKSYIVPGEGRTFIDFDLKQIEYRIIAHYTKNPAILKAYQEDPTTDFYAMMGKECDIPRQAAKGISLGSAYGMGEPKTIKMLKSAFDFSKVPAGMTIDEYCEIEGSKAYKLYHKRFPELKRTAWKASSTLRQLKYVKNLFGRIRSMPYRFHFKAFNNVIQSSAADLMKLMTIRLHERTKKTDAHLLCLVHDSWLFSVPTINKGYWVEELTRIIEETPSDLTVPIYASNKTSAVNWQECSADE